MQANMRITHEVVSEGKVILGNVVVLIEAKPKEGKADFELQWRPQQERTIQWNWMSFISQSPNGPELAIAFRTGRWELRDLPGIFDDEFGVLEKVEEKIAAI